MASLARLGAADLEGGAIEPAAEAEDAGRLGIGSTGSFLKDLA
jgi:hypothetical protein